MRRKIPFILIVLLVLLLGVGGCLLHKRLIRPVESEFAEWGDVCVESVKPIAVGATKPFSPWSPDGEWIAYSNWYSEEDQKDLGFKVEEPMGVYVVKYDGTGKKLVAADGFRPSFGRFQWQIVYGKSGTTGKPGYKGAPEEDIWVVDFDGTNNLPILADEEDVKMKNYGGSSITYDGKSVVYNLLQEGEGGGVGIANIDGSNKRRLVTNSGVWGYSADGQKVFVESVDKAKKGYVTGGWLDIKDAGVDVLKEEGIAKVEWVTSIEYPENEYGHPHVDFDGTMIAFDNPPLDYGLENREIWVGKLGGSGEYYQVTDYAGDIWANHPRWSPDGKWIVYDEQMSSEKGVKNKVMIVNVETKEEKEIYGVITVNHCGWTEPGWSPDGKKIFFYAPDSNNGNKPSVWIAVLKECGK